MPRSLSNASIFLPFHKLRDSGIFRPAFEDSECIPSHRRQSNVKAILNLCLAAALVTGTVSPSFADAQVDATLGRLGKVCKDKLMNKVKGVPMSDLHVTVGATLKESLDNGSMTLKDLQKSGASFNVEVPGKGEGYCNVNAKGRITQFSFNK
jgi:hypothetical protein